MAFSLIDDEAGAVPVEHGVESRVSRWRETAAARERDWAAAIGFAGEAGKLALVPDADGRLGRVLAGIGDGEAAIWAAAGLPEALPPGTYRLGTHARGGRSEPGRARLGARHLFVRPVPQEKEGTAPPRLVWPKGADRGLVERLAGAVCLARDLINTPASDLGPAELADAATQVAESMGARHRVIAGDALLAENYPTIHAVGRASTRAPRLVDIVWGDEGAPKVTLVGKGVCFDTGGLDLKPASGMKMMKKDMGGAAITLGLAQAVMAARLPVRLRVLLPLVENAVSGNAMRPLDIVRTRKGLTVEIGNTDAEGRLILCDALAEASTENPALLIDVATLTGAARVALGPELPALFCNDDDLASRAAGGRRGGGRPAVADAAVARLSPAARQQGRRSQQRVGRAACRRDHRGAVSAGIRRARHPLGAYRRDGVERALPPRPPRGRRGADPARALRPYCRPVRE